MLAQLKTMAKRSPGVRSLMKRTRFHLTCWEQFYRNGEWELRELSRYVPRRKLAIDVGGNIGIYSFHLSRLAKSVVIFEPQPDFADLIRGLGIPRSRVEQVALSSTSGSAILRIPLGPSGGENWGMATIEAKALPEVEASHDIEVPVRRLDDYGFKNVGFIKIDVEGHEEGVLDGAERTIAENNPALLIELEHRHNLGSVDRVVSRLQRLGYEAFFFERGQRRPYSEFRPDLHQVVDNPQLASGHITNRRDIYYINNFLFTKTGERNSGFRGRRPAMATIS